TSAKPREGSLSFVFFTPDVSQVPQPLRAGSPFKRCSRAGEIDSAIARRSANSFKIERFDWCDIRGRRTRGWTQCEDDLRRRAQEQISARNYRLRRGLLRLRQ